MQRFVASLLMIGTVGAASASITAVAANPDSGVATTPTSTSTSTCVQDDAVATPRGWQGWDRSAVIAWQAVEQAGGVVPEIEEDGTQSPPAWWRYPSALRSEALLDGEAKNAALGLYSAVPGSEIAKGDILVRTRGAGVCGKMAFLGGQVDGRWVTIEVGPDGRGPSTRPGSPLFFLPDGQTPLPETRVFRIRVRKDETIAHIRELRRDLDHLDRTVGHSPPLLAAGEEAKEAVSEKVHDLVDEAWSLVADETFDLDRRELAGRALALGAHLGWPAAAVAAGAVFDDVLKKSPTRATTVAARAALQRFRSEGAGQDGSPESTIRTFAGADEIGVESRELGFQIRWPLTWRLVGVSASAESGLLANLVTGRVLLPDGHADRAAAVLLAQRPAGAVARVTLARDGARKMFPAAKMKALPVVVPGSRRVQFSERHEGAPRTGEITTIDRDGVVAFLVLNAPADVYPKLREEYSSFVRSYSSLGLAVAGTSGAGAPAVRDPQARPVSPSRPAASSAPAARPIQTPRLDPVQTAADPAVR